MKTILDPIPDSLVLLQGNQAIARGALEAGLGWASGYPGNPSSEIIETLAAAAEPERLYVEWSVNEKVALESAAAASLAGVRALASMKQNGVNVCLDSLTNLGQSGIKAGMVLVAADDPAAISSSNEEDSRFAGPLAYLPMLEPATPQEALDMTKFAFDLSEEIGGICFVRSVSRLSHTRAGVKVGRIPLELKKPLFDTSKAYHTFPVIGKHRLAYEKLAQARARFEASSFNTYEGPKSAGLVVVACGPSYLYAREALEMMGLDGEAGLLKIGTTYPLPSDFILKHLAGASQILVAEEIDPHLEERLKAFIAQAGPEVRPKTFFGKVSGHMPAEGESSPGTVGRALEQITGRKFPGMDEKYAGQTQELTGPLTPPREFGFCPGCPHRASYWAIKNTLAADGRDGFVSGDIGCYTMGVWPTGYNQVKSVHAMGSGVGLSSGFGNLGALGFEQPVISVVGDSTFFHAAVPALINAAYTRSAFLLVVLDNAATAMTGFQPHPGTGRSASGQPLTSMAIEDICRSLGLEVEVVDPYDLNAAEEALTRGLKHLDTVRVLVFRRTCALVQGRQGGFPYRMRIDQDLCRGESCGCNRYCNRVFRCPGLVWDDKQGRAAIDELICVGCGVCEQVCPTGAIIKETVA